MAIVYWTGSLPEVRGMSLNIRFAVPGDAPTIQSIYAPFCESTVISFEAVAPTVEQMAGRMAKIMAQYPWLVCEADGQAIGYVYGSQHRERAAYRWCADVTVYIAAAYRRRGIGRALYTSLFAMLRAQGYVNVFAGVTLPNPASVGVHETVGFKPIAVYPAEGYKFGKWHDVGWWQLNLQPHVADPAEPKSITAIRDTEAIADALAAGRLVLEQRARR
jgi:L-amino acid N-acyltransferase YncA